LDVNKQATNRTELNIIIIIIIIKALDIYLLSQA
jgi:hypothetical protein